MLRTTLDKAYLKRTLRPLYGWTQATPKSEYLDPAFDRAVEPDVWPGMVATTTGAAAGTVTVAGGIADVPMGLFGLYIGGDGIDEVLDQGVNAVAVWVLGSEAEFEVLSPAFAGFAGTEPAGTLLHFVDDSGTDPSTNQGKLCPVGYASATLGDASTLPVAKLIKIVSVDKIIIGGLRGTVA